MSPLEPHYVYLAEKDGLHKVGISRDPIRRARELKATLLHTEVVAGLHAEAAMHHRLAEYRVHGEWFRFPDPSDALAYFQRGAATCIGFTPRSGRPRVLATHNTRKAQKTRDRVRAYRARQKEARHAA